MVGTKIGDNRGVTGFFEVFGPSELKMTGPTTTPADEVRLVFDRKPTLESGEFVCLRFFARTTGSKFVEVGTAQCTKAPF
ncbi:MAG: hypothetical protein ACRDRH_20565 [Pseudonocardia sp.]